MGKEGGTQYHVNSKSQHRCNTATDNVTSDFTVQKADFTIVITIINGTAYGDNTAISDSEFTNNTAEIGAGAVVDGDNAVVSNATFTDNEAKNGAGIVSSGENLNITGSTFANNTATESGAGIYCFW